MSFYKKIIAFFSKFKPKKKLLLNSGNDLKSSRQRFYESIKVEQIKKNKVEVIINVGDGLGIDTEIVS